MTRTRPTTTSPRRRRPRHLAITLAAFALVAAACGGDDDTAEPPADDGADVTEPADGTDEPAADGDGESGDLVLNGELIADAATYEAALGQTLQVYSGHNETEELALQEAFTEDTGIEVSNFRLPTGELYERIITEEGGGQLGADVIRMSDVSLLSDLKARGILSSHEITTIDALPDEMHDPDNAFYASVIFLMGLGYNTGLVDEADAPKSWNDLLDERWKGDIAMHHAGAGGSSWSWALFQRQELGIEYWEALAEQEPALYPSTAAITEELIRGEVSVAVNHIGTLMSQNEQGAPVAWVFPEEGATAAEMFIAIAEGAANREAAEVFVNWTMSLAGGDAVAAISKDYHPRPDATPPSVNGEPLPALEELNIVIADPVEWTERRETWLDEWNTIYGYSG